MNTLEKQEIKKEFQLERIILFSDAVFAIIITIMVIEIKLPEGIREATSEHQQHAFKELVPKLLGYVISFFLVAAFWMKHLKIFSFLKDYNKSLLVFNLLFLFFISLFPFTVSLISGTISPNSEHYNWGVNIYIAVVLSAIFTQALLTSYIIVNKATLCYNTNTVEKVLTWKIQKLLLTTIPLLGLIVIALNYYNLSYLYSLYAVFFLGVVNRLLKRKYYGSSNKINNTYLDEPVNE